MRILILSNLYPPQVIGGYERACANVAAGLVARGHDVQVLTTWSFVPGGEPDPPYVRRGLDQRWFLPYRHRDPRAEAAQLHEAVCSCYANTRAVIDALRAFRPDVVYVWNLLGVGIAGIIDVLNHVEAPWAVHLMDCLPGYLHDNVPPFVRDVFDARGAAFWERGTVIAMSRQILDEITERTAIRFHQGVTLVPGWVDLAASVPHGPYRRDGVTRFVACGTISEHKGVDLIIEAAAALVRAGAAPFTVDLYGDGEIGRYIDRAHGLGLRGIVRFLGARSQAALFRAYAGYDALLFPTWEREPFGFAPLEAAGCGTPPIMTRNCGAAERLVDGVHCIKIDRTADDLAAAMRGAIDGSHDLARLGRAGADLVAGDLTFERCLDQIERVLAAIPGRCDRRRLEDPRLALLTFLKHDLSSALRFG
jgi:glycosyltransferase involved in cell wall biosynthesis